jgi:hypothetical protein
MIPVCLLLQTAPAPRFFPIPENMQYEFPGVTLSDSDARVLEKAFAADLSKQDWCEKKAPLAEFPSAPISLGKLGHGVLVKGNADCLCGATGQCEMFVYVREKNGYRTVAESFGWAFGVVDSKSDVPDLAFASSGGGGLMNLILQNYNGRKYVDKLCEMLVSEEGFPKTPDDWFNPRVVKVRPCDNFDQHSK